MGYTVRVLEKAEKQMRKMDKAAAQRIKDWLTDNVEGCENPRRWGKVMMGSMRGYWRYRIGDYRVIMETRDRDMIVICTETGHRREAYR